MPDPKVLLTDAETDNDDPTASAIWDTSSSNAKLIEVVSTGYTGTIDVQGQMGNDGDVWHPATYQRKTDAGSYGSASAAQVALTDDSQTDLFLVSEPWTNMRILVERTSGAGTLRSAAQGLSGGGVSLTDDISAILAAVSSGWVRDEVELDSQDFSSPVTILDLEMGAGKSCSLGGVYADLSDFTATATITFTYTLPEGIFVRTTVVSATNTMFPLVDSAIPMAEGDTLVITAASDNAGDTSTDITVGYRYQGSAPTQN